MSAWYVLASLGVYPEVPASGRFVAAAPQVRAARLDMGGGRVLRMVRTGVPADVRAVPVITLNGRTVGTRDISHQDLAAGGVLAFRYAEAGR